MKQKIIILKGLPASGKSTWAREQVDQHPNVYKRINKDDLRAMLDNGKHSKGREQFIIDARNGLIASAIGHGFSVIVDDTNLNPIHEQQLRELFGSETPIEVKFFDVDVYECIRRDGLRGDKAVGEHAIRDMHKRWLRPVISSQLVQDQALPHAIICDLDGTLALIGDRSPYDASKCADDKLNEPVAKIITAAAETGLKVIFMSGREDKYQAETFEFLKRHLGDTWWFEHCDLAMRTAGDKRKDAIVKRELFDEHIRGKFYIEYVLDDRDQVVEMWRDLGLTCLQVADGNF